MGVNCFVCSIYLIVLPFMMIFLSAILIGISNSPQYQSDFFQSSNQAQSIAGFAVLGAAFFILIVGICLCCYVCKSSKGSSQDGSVLNPGPLVSGQAPPGPVSGYHVQGQQPAAAGYPAHELQPYPSPGTPQAYPPPQQVNTPPPSRSAPVAGYQPSGGYAPSGSSAAPPSYQELLAEKLPRKY